MHPLQRFQGNIPGLRPIVYLNPGYEGCTRRRGRQDAFETSPSKASQEKRRYERTSRPRCCLLLLDRTQAALNPTTNIWSQSKTNESARGLVKCPQPSTPWPSLIVFLLVALVLSSTTVASPLPQAVPDKSGNTGSGPCLTQCNDRLRPVVPTISVFSSNPTPAVSSTGASSPNTTRIPNSTTAATSTPNPTLNPNANAQTPPDGISGNPNPNSIPEPLTRTSPKLLLPAGAIAGIAGGALLLVFVIVVITTLLYRRRHMDVKEISIRRSKLGSRLGFRIFGHDHEGEGRDKSTQRKSQGTFDEKSGQQGGWLENGFLSVPKPSFLGRQDSDVSAPWVDKGSIGRPKAERTGFVRLLEDVEREKSDMSVNGHGADGEKTDGLLDKNLISGPRPARPASAEPLGRLSGLGMGMGYLK